VSGRVWRFGDDVDTDALAPGAYMKASLDVLASHCLESLDPGFAQAVRPGDVVVAGRNFGLGSSREQAAQALVHLGVAAVVARSFAGIFHRNALNLGLPVVVCEEAGRLQAGERVEVDAGAGEIRRQDGSSLACEPLPPFLLAMLADGGLVPHLERKLAAAAAKEGSR